MFEFLAIRRDGPVEYLTLNRPDVRNAFNDVVIAELQRWAEGAAADPALRVVVLGGAGKVFSAGADATWMARMAGYSREENEADARRTTAMLRALNTLPVARDRPDPGSGARRRRRAGRDLRRRRRRGSRRLRLHRDQARHRAGDDLALRPAQDRRLGGTRAVPHRHALRRRAGQGDRLGPRRRRQRRARRHRAAVRDRGALGGAVGGEPDQAADPAGRRPDARRRGRAHRDDDRRAAGLGRGPGRPAGVPRQAPSGLAAADAAGPGRQPRRDRAAGDPRLPGGRPRVGGRVFRRRCRRPARPGRRSRGAARPGAGGRQLPQRRGTARRGPRPRRRRRASRATASCPSGRISPARSRTPVSPSSGRRRRPSNGWARRPAPAT